MRPFRILLILLLLTPLPAVSGEVPFAFTAPGGELAITPNHDLLASLEVTLADGGRGNLRFPLGVQRALLVELGDGAPTALRDGSLPLQGLNFIRADGSRSPDLALSAAPGGGMAVELVDADGRVWLRVGDAMRSPEPADGLRLISADLRVGPALAAWTGTDSVGLLLGGATLQVPLGVVLGAAAAAPKSCIAPNWPDAANGWHVDVQLTGINSVDVPRCRMSGEVDTECRAGVAYTCDGPGGDDGEVVILPSAMLRNSDALDTADVPWFAKFAPPSASVYPPGVDQHPFLVWNLYRMDADGALVQVARSGLKHAFATQNTGCADTSCASRHNILGRGCGDIYDAASNDRHDPRFTVSAMSALAPRSEVIPAKGQWGRCGSVFDDDCDGNFDPPPADDCDYKYRMVAREDEIDPAQNPGARWFVDAWYVVRDDRDIFNTMGFREIHPHWLGGFPARWDAGSLGAFRQGSVADVWLEQAAPAEWTHRTMLDEPDGHVLIAARVRRDGGAYRYDYAVANFDFARATTEGAEPNLRVTSNRGLDAFSVEHAHGAAASASAYRDGDATVANDWSATTDLAKTTWQAPNAAAHLPWGQLTSFTLHSPHPPGEGVATLVPVGAGEAGSLQAATLVPDASKIFSDRFE